MRTRRRSSRQRRRRTRHGIDMDDADVEDCLLLDRDNLDSQRLAKSIDEEYAIEEAKLHLTFWEVLER